MKRKTKLVLIILGGIIVSIVLYTLLQNKKITIVSIGDSNYLNTNSKRFDDYYYEYLKKQYPIKEYNKDYLINDLTSTELLNILINNRELNNKNIKQLINKANYIIIYIGQTELKKHGNINIYLYNMNKILKIIRDINKKNIYLISLYQDNLKIKDINQSLRNTCTKYNIKYIDIEKINNDNLTNEELHFRIFQKILANE